MFARRFWTVLAVVGALLATIAHAEIYRLDNGEVIPGTEGITPGPGVQLDHMALEYAQLWDTNLADAQFEQSSLSNAVITSSNLTGANLRGVNLIDAYLADATLMDTDFTAASVQGTMFSRNTWRGFSKEQLYSTASYQEQDLRGIRFYWEDLTEWNFIGQDLTDAGFYGSDLTDATLENANLTNVRFFKPENGPTMLTNASLANAIVVGASFSQTNLTKEQLYSTASYRQKELIGIDLRAHDLTAWDLTGQDLRMANLWSATLTDAKLAGADFTNANLTYTVLGGATLSEANLKNARLSAARNMSLATFDSKTEYNQWTIFPRGFDPKAAGLSFSPSSEGDFDANDTLEAIDIDMLTDRIFGRGRLWWLDDMFDLNRDNNVDQNDHQVWVKSLLQSWYGDANCDGEFDSDDFVQVFQAGKYETGPVIDVWGRELNRASWSEGDWNGDGIFTSDDFITAFMDNGYELGPRLNVATVPESTSTLLFGIGLIGVTAYRRRPRN